MVDMKVYPHVRKVLVRVPNWIGDAVLCTPALMSLRQKFPSAQITVLARRVIGELLKGHPGIDDILIYDHQGIHRGIRGKWNLVRVLRENGFEWVVLFQNAFEAALLTYLAGIPHRLGYARDGRRFLLSEPISVPDRKWVPHHVQYFEYLVEPSNESKEQVPPRLHLFAGEEENVWGTLQPQSLKKNDILIGMNPGSIYGTAKRWLPERFANVADRIIDELTGKVGEGAVRCVIVGGPGEEVLGEQIAKAMRHAPLILSGKTSLREMMVVVKKCQLFITNDTGPMHVAHAFGVPVVAIFGPTDSHNTGPFQNMASIVRNPVSCSPCLLRHCPIDHRCMTGISVEEVVNASMVQVSVLVKTPSPQHPG
jgi:heptosyltransferase-2